MEKLIAHFEGPKPYPTDFRGDPNGHLGQKATVTGGVIYRPGKFGKAAQFAGATMNLCHNPTLGGTYTGGVASGTTESDPGGTLTPSKNTDPRFIEIGTASQKIKFAGGQANDFLRFEHATMNNATTYTWFVRFYLESGSVNLSAWKGDTSVSQTFSQKGWHTFELTDTSTASGSNFAFLINAPTAAAVVYVDQVQIEQKSYRTPLCSGELGAGHSWSGTAHNSTSSRTGALLTYETAGNIRADRGTVAAWIYILASTGTDLYVFRVVGTTGLITLVLNSSLRLVGYWSANSVSTDILAAKTWYHVAMTFDGETLTVYINGVQVAAQAASGFAGMPATMSVGTSSSSGGHINGYVDDLTIYDHAASAAEIRALYEDAGMLRIIGEGLGSVNLLNPAGLYLANGGWRQQIGAPNELGAYEPLWESMEMAWMEATDDARAESVQLLHRLGRLARQRREQRTRKEYIYLEVRGHSESEPRYAELNDVAVRELDERRYGPQIALDMVLGIRREALWRASRPDTGHIARSLTLSPDLLVYSRHDGEGVNYVTIDGETEVAGDAPADAIIQVAWETAATDLHNFILALRSADDLADLTSLKTQFNASDELDQTKTSDANAPDGERIDLTVSDDLRWQLPDTLRRYAGSYLVYIVADALDSNSAKVHFEHANVKGEGKFVPKFDGSYGLTYLGHFNIPSGRHLPNEVDPAIYELKLPVVITGGTTFRFYTMWLVPVDQQFFQAFDLEQTDPTLHLKINGELEETYLLRATGQLDYGTSPAPTRGRYLRLPPRKHLRLDFFGWESATDVGAGFCTLSIKVLPRYLALRGDE